MTPEGTDTVRDSPCSGLPYFSAKTLVQEEHLLHENKCGFEPFPSASSSRREA